MKPSYEQLEQQLAESQSKLEKMAAENVGLKESRKNLAEFIHEEINADYPLNMDIETPATSAFLAEVRAQGVEMFATKTAEGLRTAGGAWGVIQEPYHEVADYLEGRGERFAAQLRQGGAV